MKNLLFYVLIAIGSFTFGYQALSFVTNALAKQAQSSPRPQATPEAAKTELRTEASVVMVTNQEQTGGGTGFSTNTAKGTAVIVTNDHVCNASTGGYVRIQDDSGNEYIKKVLKRNFMRDLCLIEGISAPPLAIASKQPVRFDRLRVVGHPLLQPTSRSEGEFVKNIIIPLGLPALADGTCKEGATPVESFFGTFCIVNMEVGYTTVLIWGGNSGSPIVNKDGEVVGVINSADNRTNQGNFIPLPYLKEMLAD